MILVSTTILFLAEIVVTVVRVPIVEKYAMMDVDAVTVDAVEIVIMKVSMHLGLI